VYIIQLTQGSLSALLYVEHNRKTKLVQISNAMQSVVKDVVSHVPPELGKSNIHSTLMHATCRVMTTPYGALSAAQCIP
jgi:hypothetical protein